MAVIKFSMHFACWKCEENIGMPVVHDERMCNMVEMVSVNIFSVSADGGGQVDVNAGMSI